MDIHWKQEKKCKHERLTVHDMDASTQARLCVGKGGDNIFRVDNKNR